MKRQRGKRQKATVGPAGASDAVLVGKAALDQKPNAIRDVVDRVETLVLVVGVHERPS
jgi:hypothetical protein